MQLYPLAPPPPLQLEKKQHLVEQEERRMREKDAQHSQEMKEWRSSLASRKKVGGISCCMDVMLGVTLEQP